MNVRQFAPDVGWIATVLVAVLVGMSLATMVTADPVALPLVGTVDGVVAGGIGLVVGVGLYTQLPDGDCCSGADSCSRGDCGP